MRSPSNSIEEAVKNASLMHSTNLAEEFWQMFKFSRNNTDYQDGSQCQARSLHTFVASRHDRKFKTDIFQEMRPKIMQYKGPVIAKKKQIVNKANAGFTILNAK